MSGFFMAWGVGWLLVWACVWAIGILTSDDDWMFPGALGMIAAGIWIIATTIGIVINANV